MTRRGDWMQTYSGRQFWPLDPDPEAVDIVDIAHALSMSCRYAGHTTRFYSVAEHSVHVMLAASPEHRRWALLHDAAEAYVVDVPRPLKPHLPGYREAEAAVMAAICARYGLGPDMPDAVKDIDDRILVDERAALMAPCAVDWNLRGPAVGAAIHGYLPEAARDIFLGWFFTLFPEELTR